MDITAYTHRLYDLSGMIHRLKMKDIRLRSGVKLNSAALSLLNVIDLEPGLSVTELAKRMGLTKSAVSQMLKKLCALGLAGKSRSDSNDKNVYPVLTETGRATAAEYREKHDRFYACVSELLGRYDPDGQELIYRFLSEAGEAVKRYSDSIGVDAERPGGERK